MESQFLPVNLRLLCSYVGSVSECSRKMGINRQQLSKYLNGYSQPSMQTLRKICDYFGVDSDEIYLEPEQFKDLISTQKKSLAPESLLEDTASGKRYTKQLKNMMAESSQSIERYLGDYYYYYMTPSYEGCISKGFARLSLRNGVGYSHFYERANPEQAMQEGAEIGKFVGLVFLLGERLQIVDYSVHCQRAISQTILYGATKGNIHLLSGLTMGIQGRNSRIPFTSRVVFEKISDKPSLKDKLKQVQLLTMDSENVAPAILSRLASSSSIDNEHIFTAAENF
ncbi:helix-turn-helix transcriptional regulator [Vibrio natriegens]|uniref:helix-turn-helix domain-containing protein n=1 Tax=Vibrio natriegens TaxID=691 RepID=UPI001592B79B|nr:helix-turn-helix transcriptional regulator [Vibrio natriegens]NVC95779.1 helix-turn-helix transcriptional regulator [Vibrio natriegens]